MQHLSMQIKDIVPKTHQNKRKQRPEEIMIGKLCLRMGYQIMDISCIPL